MSSVFRRPRTLAAGALAIAASGAVAAAMLVPTGSALASGSNKFHQTNLISNRSDQGAQVVDQHVKNPWGLAFGLNSPLWVANNNDSSATVYFVSPPSGSRGPAVTNPGLVVNLPGTRPSTGDGGSPTGQVRNAGTGFVVTTAKGRGAADFIFSSESGQITAWSRESNGFNHQDATVEFSSPTAVYKGLAMATTLFGHTMLYATNFHDGMIDEFTDKFVHFAVTNGFRDPSLPAGYAPFGIQPVNGDLYVTYALQNDAKHDDVAGPGHGFVDVYTPDGILLKRLISGGALNSPWGMAIAPQGFGPFGGDLLVGNFGDGMINAFNPSTGAFLGSLNNEAGQPLVIDKLWGLAFGTSSITGGPTTLLFSAGINDEQDGLVGAINAVP